MFVGIGDVFGVGRPDGVVEEAGIGAQIDDGGGLEAGLVVKVELILTGSIGKIGDGFSVRAPGGIALCRAGGIGEVAGVAFLGGNGEDFAVRLKSGADSGGRKGGILNFFRWEVGAVGYQVGQFAVNLDGNDAVGVGSGIEQVNRAELLIDKAAGACLHRFQVEAVVGNSLCDLLCRDVVSEQRDGSVAVGEEVDRVARPDGVGVVGVLSGHLNEVKRFEIHNPDGRGLSAHIALPGWLPFGYGLVGDRLAVGREGAFASGGQRQRFGRPRSIDMDAEETIEVAKAGLAAGDKNVLAIWRPAYDNTAVGMPREAAWNSACGRNDVDIGVAAEMGRVGDPCAVGRVDRAGVNLPVGGETLRIAALAAHRPDVIRVTEGDFVLAKGWVAKQERG